MMKVKMLIASFMLALAALFMSPTGSVAAGKTDGFSQTQDASQPLEMRRGWGGHRGWGRGRGWGHRRMYRRAYYRPAPRFYAAPYAYCRTVIRYNRWGEPRRRRICR
jgi:hypothetical protein